MSGYANVAASSRLPKAANMNGAPRGVATVRARPSLAKAYRPTVTVGPVRRQFSANMNRSPAPWAVPKGIEPFVKSGFDLHPGIWAAAELQAAMAQSVWDMYLVGDVVPVGMMAGTRVVSGEVEWYCGAVSQTTSVTDPGASPASLTTALNAYYWAKAIPVADQWRGVYGFTPAEISPAKFGKLCQWHFNLAPKGQPQPSPYVRVAVEEVPTVGRVVDNPYLMADPAFFDVAVRAQQMKVTQGGAPRASREEVSKRGSPIAYGLMRALEGAGDVGALAAIWYRAAREQLHRQTGMYVVPYNRASAETRLDVMVWGLTNGVDFQTLAEGAGQWWIGEKIGAVLGPTVRGPGDSFSGNVRHYQVTQAFRDALG